MTVIIGAVTAAGITVVTGAMASCRRGLIFG
jgi:hypothetical protein